MRVLLAEDDPHISLITKLCLERLAGFDVLVVADGTRALETALTQKFDLLLLDEMMPGLNGLRVAEAYRTQATDPSPVIFLSAKSQEQDIRAFLAHGTGYIAKPFDPMTLPQQILQMLGRTS